MRIADNLEKPCFNKMTWQNYFVLQLEIIEQYSLVIFCASIDDKSCKTAVTQKAFVCRLGIIVAFLYLSRFSR